MTTAFTTERTQSKGGVVHHIGQPLHAAATALAKVEQSHRCHSFIALRRGSPFSKLLVQATAALHTEDTWLRRAFDASSHAYPERGAPGLGYWVFEHNLVLPIFRSWVPEHRILWDETVNAQWSRGTGAKSHARTEAAAVTKKKFIDLQILSEEEHDDARTLCEAKWINNDKGRRAAEKDHAFLQRACANRPAWEAYQLLFQSGDAAHIRAGHEWLGSWNVVFVGMFQTRLANGHEGERRSGVFAMYVARATPEAPAAKAR